MNKRLRTNSQADAEESSGPGLSLDEHTTVIMSRSVVVERHIQLADFYELRFEDRTLPEIVEQAGWLPFLQRTGYVSKNLLQDDFMPAGGKRLQCDSSVQAESSLGTLAVSGPSLRDRNELPSLTQPVQQAPKVVVHGRGVCHLAPPALVPPKPPNQGACLWQPPLDQMMARLAIKANPCHAFLTPTAGHLSLRERSEC
ncbi:hypothetical protein CJ030_MR3G007097 [Morella rubra]|uniref:Uncharacterized protein n=1 Tax=Morella rubra TaxID=262757 RepID=A0A6A1W6W5_9ROSI|nr:hypothetical protein CJ030_MR3G007097 [Morella rubra]